MGSNHPTGPATERRPTPKAVARRLRSVKPPPPASAAPPPPGLDAARHRAAQAGARGADVLRQAFVPACMAAALSSSGLFDGSAFRCYLDQFLQDAGAPRDPVERL